MYALDKAAASCRSRRRSYYSSRHTCGCPSRHHAGTPRTGYMSTSHRKVHTHEREAQHPNCTDECAGYPVHQWRKSHSSSTMDDADVSTCASHSPGYEAGRGEPQPTASSPCSSSHVFSASPIPNPTSASYPSHPSLPASAANLTLLTTPPRAAPQRILPLVCNTALGRVRAAPCVLSGPARRLLPVSCPGGAVGEARWRRRCVDAAAHRAAGHPQRASSSGSKRTSGGARALRSPSSKISASSPCCTPSAPFSAPAWSPRWAAPCTRSSSGPATW